MAESLSLYDRTKPNYRKHFIPLESDPEIFTGLIKELGVEGYEFQDVYSLDDPDLLSFIPRPVVALILVFPTSDGYEARTKALEASRKVYEGKGEGEPVFWISQSIQNACGLYAVLHAISNGVDRSAIKPGSAFDEFLREATPLAPFERTLALENSEGIAAAHKAAAMQGQSAAPEAQAEVDFHYICFVRSKKDHHLYEMNGCVKGPIDSGLAPAGEDILDDGIKLVKEYVNHEGGDVGFSLLALVST